MSYLSRLIERAVNPELGSPDLENNSIGNYRIEPQHGPNCYKYNIYKTMNTRFSLRFDQTEEFLCDIVITFSDVVVNWRWGDEHKKDKNNIVQILKEIYGDRHEPFIQENESSEPDTISNEGTQRSPFDFGIGS